MKFIVISGRKRILFTIILLVFLLIPILRFSWFKDIPSSIMVEEEQALLKITSLVENQALEEQTEIEKGIQEQPENKEESLPETKKYIKWVDFNVCYSALEKAMNLDITSYNTSTKFNWIETLSYLACKYGGNFSRYKEKDINTLVEKVKSGKTMEELTSSMKYYNYYLEAYTAVLGGFIGEYQVQTASKSNPNEMIWQDCRGLKVFSPIAKGYGLNHYDDFGDQRSYGYARRHLGHDILGSIGTPIVAIESGVVEVMGWNQYGGWRIGIRSFDGKRYYYYAHLKKDKPFHKDLYEGKTVKAGDVIGFLGMTGYSSKENVNNIKTPHLHLGIQLIFNEVQKDGINQIWIDPYNIVKLLQKNRSTIYRDKSTNEIYRKYDFNDFSGLNNSSSSISPFN